MKICSKMKALSCPQHFLHYKSMGKKFDAQGQVTPKRIVRSGWKLNSSEILCLSLLSASLTKIHSKVKALPCPQHFFRRSDKKLKVLSCTQHFPHYKSMGAFGCHGNYSFDWICPKTLCSLSPTPEMLHIFKIFKVWKCQQQKTDGWMMDDCYTIGHLVSLWLRWAKNLSQGLLYSIMRLTS